MSKVIDFTRIFWCILIKIFVINGETNEISFFDLRKLWLMILAPAN